MNDSAVIEQADYPRIVVKPPGPKAQAIIDRDSQWTSSCYIKEYPLVIGGGRGAMVEDVDGNRYIDWMAGIATCATGHAHPDVVRAVQEAAGRFLHICGTDFYYESLAVLAERLCKIAPGESRKRVFVTNSGSEAVDGAIKLARRHTGRRAIISFLNSFHGRTYGAITVSASKTKYREGFGPLLPGVYHLPYDNPYRGAGVEHALEAAHTLFEMRLSPREVAAVMIEPIQGEGGYIVPRPEFLHTWRRICDENGILLIFDEIQSGIGRTGKMWAADHVPIEPDVVLTGKGLGSGMPVGAIIAKESVMTWPRGSHGSTFGGNPVCCAAALATLDLVEASLMENAAKMGTRLLAGLRKLQERHACIGDVRGLGLMIGIEFVEDRFTKEPAEGMTYALEKLAFTKGLLLLSCARSVIRVAPPLVLTEYDVDRGLEIMDECLTELTN